MAISISGAVLSGMGSSFVITGGKRNGLATGGMTVGRKSVIIIAPNRQKSLILAAAKGDSDNSKLDPKWLDDASQKASEYMKEKGSEMGQMSAQRGQEVLDHIQNAKDFIAGKAGEAMDKVTQNTQKASDFANEKGKETQREAGSMTEKAKDFIVEKTGEAKDSATDLSQKTTKYVKKKAGEAKDAILPPKT